MKVQVRGIDVLMSTLKSLLAHAAEEGKPSVGIRIELPGAPTLPVFWLGVAIDEPSVTRAEAVWRRAGLGITTIPLDITIPTVGPIETDAQQSEEQPPLGFIERLKSRLRLGGEE